MTAIGTSCQSVETIGKLCFCLCENLSTVQFELNSRLSVLEEDVFMHCFALKTIWIPSHLQTLIVGQFQSSSLDAPVCPNFHVIVIENGLAVELYVEEC
jgi:hypothetical protein